MEQLKDQQKLFEKLFISPTATTRSPHLVLSMQFLKLLLDEAPQLAPAPLKHLLLKILGLFEIQPINSLLLYNHDWTTTGQTPLLTEIILACAKGVNSRQEGEQYLSMLDSLISYYPVALLHICSITRQFSLQFNEGRFQPLKSWFLHKVLEKYYGPKRGLKTLPQSCFFFYGCTEVSTIHSFEDMRVKLKQEIAIVFSFYLVEKPREDLIICRVKTNRESIVVKVGQRISIQNETTSQRVVEEEEIKAEQWVRIVINLSPSETVVFLNDEQITRERAIIRKEKERELIEYSFGQQLVGFMTGMALAHRVVPSQLIKRLPQFKDWYQISFVREQNLEDIFLLCCLPFSTFEMRGANHCFDIFQRIHSQIGQNIILFKNVTEYAGFQSMGGPEILLPLFYIARFYDPFQYPDQLECLLKIWLSSMTLFPNYDKAEQFLLVLGHHLEALPQLLTLPCVNLLGVIYQRHSLPNKTHFLRHIAWSGLPAKTSCSASAEWMHWLTKLYQNNKSHCLGAYGLLDVVYWLVIHLQDSTHSCCPQHYLSQARVLRQFSMEQMSRIEDNSKRLHFEAVENIAAVILEYYLIDQHPSTQRKLKGILRLLLHKYSACLCKTILSIFKRQFPKFKDDKALCLFFLEADLVPFLAALAQKTVDAGLIALIVYLLLMVCSYREGGKSLAVDYLAIVFRRMETIYEQHFNPVTHGVKKLRKKSLGSGDNRGYTELVGKIQNYKEDMTQVAIILLNFCLGAIAEKELVKESRLVGEKPLCLLRYLMPIAGSKTRTFILQSLEAKIEQHPGNMEWCLHSREFNELLLMGAQQKGKDSACAKRLMVKCLKWMLRNTTQITQHYILLKTLTKSQIDLTPLISEIFYDVTSQNPHLSLDQLQILLLVVSAEYHQTQPSGCSPYWRLMRLFSQQICSLLDSTLNIDRTLRPSQLLQRLRTLPADTLKVVLFNLQLNVISEQDITFLFDICLPKAAAGCNVEALFQQTKRRVYVLQILVWSLLEIVFFEGEPRKEVIHNLLWLLKIFLGVSLLKSELSIDKSFVRMVIFITSHTLSFSTFKEELADLWLWILELTKIQALQYKADSYQDLMAKLAADKTQPYMTELFETFLRANNEEYLLTFSQLLSYDPAELSHFVHSQISQIMSLKSMGYAIQQCKQYAFNELSLIFSSKIRNTRERLDSQAKNNERELVREVERLFEQESVGEEETRIRYLHQYECSLRTYYSTWKKIWKRLRIYHHPYGLFMAQKDTPNCFQFLQTPLKNFRFKISKFSSQSFIQPILEAQVLEPWHVRKTLKRDAKNELSSLVEMARPTYNPRKRESLTQMATNLFRTLRGQKKKQQSGQYDVIWIKRGRKARGRLLVCDNFQLVFWYDSLKQQDSHLSFERFSLPYDKPMVKRWRVDLIRKISLRRYLMQWHALEIELIYSKSLLFYFCEQKESQFLDDIVAIRNTRIGHFGQRLKVNKVPLYMDGWYSQQFQGKITEEWLSRKRSTLSYLLAVNQAASRSILDISQYPVVPWVSEMSQNKQPVMRELAKSMGALGSQDRIKIVKEKFNSKDPFNPVPPFFFGTHYSSPGVVFNYLIRVAPFTDYCKNLQGGKFDIPDRLFASLLTAWKSASSEVSDVREMIPEFYYLPELLINLERLHFGLTQGGEQVNHVELPPWAGTNPYFLVAQLRQMLESDQVSGQISRWVDFIFGKGQKGKQAVDNLNVYYYLTYEDYSNCLHNEQDEVYKKSCEAQIIHFGQIPAQIFESPHPQRLPLPKPPTELSVRTIDLINVLNDKPIGLLRTSAQISMVRRNEIQTLITGKSPAVLTKAVEFNLERTISKKLFNLKKECGRAVFFKKYFLIYGYVTNQFRIFNRSHGSLQYDDQLDSKVECAVLNDEESLLLIGCQSGLLHIYELEYETHRVNPKKVLSLPFPNPVVHISQHDGFFAISFGCYVAIYKIERPFSFLSKEPVQPFIRFFRSFQNSLPVKGAFIADAPLYCLVLYDNAHVKVYSINGQLMRSISLAAKGIQRMLDSQLHSLFIIHEEGRLTLVSTPDLRSLSQMDIPGAMQVAQGVVVYKNRLDLIDCLN